MKKLLLFISLFFSLSLTTHAQIIGDTTLCKGDSTILTHPTPNGKWYSANITIAAIDSLTGMLIGIDSGTTTITYKTTRESDTIAVIVHPLPNPIIMVNAFEIGTLRPYSTYQWYAMDTPVTGATQRYYTLTTNGRFKVVVTDTNGCHDTSDVYEISNNVQSVNANKININIHPNPANNVININSDIHVDISVCSMDGRELIKINKAVCIDISSLADGMYIFRTRDANTGAFATGKFIKNSQ